MRSESSDLCTGFRVAFKCNILQMLISLTPLRSADVQILEISVFFFTANCDVQSQGNSQMKLTFKIQSVYSAPLALITADIISGLNTPGSHYTILARVNGIRQEGFQLQPDKGITLRLEIK